MRQGLPLSKKGLARGTGTAGSCGRSTASSATWSFFDEELLKEDDVSDEKNISLMLPRGVCAVPGEFSCSSVGE